MYLISEALAQVGYFVSIFSYSLAVRFGYGWFCSAFFFYIYITYPAIYPFKVRGNEVCLVPQGGESIREKENRKLREKQPRKQDRAFMISLGVTDYSYVCLSQATTLLFV